MLRSKAVVAVLLLLAITLTLGCSREPGQIRIGYIPHSSGLPFFVAHDEAYFEQEGLAVEFVQCGYRDFMDALLTGRVDVIAPTSFPSLFGVEAESPGTLRFFATGGEKSDGDLIYGMLVREDSPISGVAGLKGQRVGVTDPVTAANLKLILTKLGLDPDVDVSVLQVNRGVILSGLIAGQIDCILLSQPDLAAALQQGEVRVLLANPRAKYIIDPYWSGAAATTASFAEQNKADLSRVFRAVDRAIDYIRANPDAARQKLVVYASLTPEIAEATGMYFSAKTTEEVDLDAIQYLATQLHEEGILSVMVDAGAAYLDYSMLR